VLCLKLPILQLRYDGEKEKRHSIERKEGNKESWKELAIIHIRYRDHGSE
jgi:hypothetical protein